MDPSGYVLTLKEYTFGNKFVGLLVRLMHTAAQIPISTYITGGLLVISAVLAVYCITAGACWGRDRRENDSDTWERISDWIKEQVKQQLGSEAWEVVEQAVEDLLHFFAKKKDIQQVTNAGRQAGVNVNDNECRRLWGEYIEEQKAYGRRGSRSNGDFTWNELIDLAYEFLDYYPHCEA